MAKLKNPLFSLEAIRSVGKALSFRRSRGRNIVEKKPEVPDSRTLAQLSWRHMYQKAVALWHALGAEEKQEWESLARPKHMTGFAWFISQALKPNPGLYLPLQGGKMAGDIDMDGHEIEDLPDPTQDQDAATKKYHDDNLPPGGYTEGCRVWHSFSQTISTGAPTYLSFNSEDYDTDEMHDLVVNPGWISIKTAGIYLIIFQAAFQQNATGEREVNILRDSEIISRFLQDSQTLTHTFFNLSTVSQFTVGQYLRVRVIQDSGGDLSIVRASSYSAYFMAQRIG